MDVLAMTVATTVKMVAMVSAATVGVAMTMLATVTMVAKVSAATVGVAMVAPLVPRTPCQGWTGSVAVKQAR